MRDDNSFVGGVNSPGYKKIRHPRTMKQKSVKSSFARGSAKLQDRVSSSRKISEDVFATNTGYNSDEDSGSISLEESFIENLKEIDQKR